MDELERAIELAGSQAKLARKAEVSLQALNNAVRRKSVSPDLALKIEIGLKGEVRKENLVWPTPNTKKSEAA